MARSASPRAKAGGALLGLLAIVLVLLGLGGLGVAFSPAPTFQEKLGALVPRLGLDLEGGTQVILRPQTDTGAAPTQEQLDQSVAIIRQRVNAAGITEAQVSTSGENLVVSIPGTPSDETLNSVRASARMDFRPVLATTASATASVDEEGAAYTPPATLEATPSVAPTDGSDLNQVTPYLADLFENFSCGQGITPATDNADQAVVTCDPTGTQKYLLGPIEVPGSNIEDAQAGIRTNAQGVSTGEWVVNLSFNGEGTRQFSDVTTRLIGLQGAQNQFAIVLDDTVISAPTVNNAITNGDAEISGGFTQESSQALAQQLRFGALPISFAVQSQNTISATLGTASLVGGLIAGLIGLALVVVYSLAQYRTLGLVTVASLAVAAVLTYLVIDFLSWRQGFRLSLAGIAGLIIGIGITADSFIVYFERIRDELREGKSLPGAVEAGWRRALRTIAASAGVNLIAAVVLFVLAVGDVRGFALTLGIATIIDFTVVTLFTHPVLQLLAQRRFFAEGHRLSGLDPRALGAVYRGRGQFRQPVLASTSTVRSRGEAQRRQTIAERKAGGATTATAVKPRERKDG